MSLDNVGLLFPVCDEDERHFTRFMNELERLNLKYAVHFDHCSERTKRLFGKHRLCIGVHYDDDSKSFFDESYRQHALDILVENGFEWMLQMDIDETLEKRALEKIEDIISYDLDVATCRVLDFWENGNQYRTDGPFRSGTREKILRIKGNTLRYPHPTAHAPNVVPLGKTRDSAIVTRYPLYVLHWGIMNLEDAKFHRQRWERIYKRKVGNNPYGGYNYYFEPTTQVTLEPFDYNTFESDWQPKRYNPLENRITFV